MFVYVYIMKLLGYVCDECIDTNTSISGLKAIGGCLIIAPNKENDFENNNGFIVVCSAIVSSSNKAFEPTTVYFPVEFRGLIKFPNEEYAYTPMEYILGYSRFSNDSYWTDGYIDGKEMYSEIVTENTEEYEYQIFASLKIFSE